MKNNKIKTIHDLISKTDETLNMAHASIKAGIIGKKLEDKITEAIKILEEVKIDLMMLHDKSNVHTINMYNEVILHLESFIYKYIAGDGLPLEAVGKILGVTRERVRQIESQVLKKLRHPKYSKGLSDVLRIQNSGEWVC